MEKIDSKEILHDVPPYIRVYKDGTVERLVGTEIAPANLDPETGVDSKDVVFQPETGVSARLYRPTTLPIDHRQKLPLVVYFHGGAFCISSTADPKYHQMLNLLVQEAQIVLLAVDYRRVPEHPLSAAYEDSWAAIKWVFSHIPENDEGNNGTESWLRESVDFGKIFLAGDSAGANISHHMAIRIGSLDPDLVPKIKISGILMVHPYFWGEEAIGVEAENPFFKGVVDKWWLFVCPSDLGCDDPLINPFVDGAPGLEELGCDRILVCVAGNDILRERGKLYYQSLVKSKWGGKAEYCETQGVEHVFHIMDPTDEKSINFIKRCGKFINSI